MLNVKRIPVNMLEENCYIVSDDTGKAVIIDCGALYENDRNAIQTYLRENGLTVEHHLCTHMHYDHCFGAAFLADSLHVAPEYNADDEMIYNGMGSDIFGPLVLTMTQNRPAAARYLNDGDTVAFGRHRFVVLQTPGHSPGGLCFYCEAERTVFVGDTIFRCSIGRSDLPGGNEQALLNSIRNKLFVLPDETVVYPGHGPQTQIGFEKQNNPYVS